ncbi:hypothetical protein [Paraliomyxa miuraensis]|uniref:hypothetical protein n=1 Tax=Paraliomyxa miuraensis TaxID=376150 RepID=UPI00225428EF|nr:hypothetical protein [Paraliomyxa miuraensis]MCX4245245.1 hypothetical protein [Paraliomyxa miuraensis]
MARLWSGLGRGGSLALALTVGGLCLPRTASAIEYEIFVDVDDEEDLDELSLNDQISDETYQDLVELLRRGTNLDEASRDELYALPNLSYEEVDRILAYRAEAGRIADPADLVVAGVLTRRKLAAIAAFLLVPDPTAKGGGVSGRIRYRMTYAAQDPRVPPMALQARIKALGNLTMGVAAMLDPQRMGPVSHDPNRDALLAEPYGLRPRLPKAFVQWDTARWSLIAGTYRAGFGQRLTFDNSRRYTPNGLYLDDALVNRYDLTSSCRETAGELQQAPCDSSALRVAPSFQMSPGLQGAAAGAKHLPLPVGWMQAYVFWSMQNLDLYQYRIYDRTACEDPRSDDAACRSPTIYKAQDDPLAPTTAYRYATLPNMVDLVTQGANLAWWADERNHLGVTGYGSVPRWRVEGADLDFQTAERYPRGGAFGAVGADFSWGHRWADVFGEVSRSFDGTPSEQNGGGGFAGILRHTASWKDQELEVSARYYDQRFANPYARPISSRDRYDGNQGRDEAGVRVRYNGTLAERVDLRAFNDVWVRTESKRVRMRSFVRADADVTKWWRPGLWLEYQTQDMSKWSFAQCTELEELPQGSATITTPIICGGQRVQLTARSRFQPHKKLHFTLQYRHEFQNSEYVDTDLPRDNDFEDPTGSSTVDTEDYTGGVLLPGQFSGSSDDRERFERRNRLRQDINAFLMVTAKLTDDLRLRGRVRWYWEDIADNSRFEHSVWAYVEARYQIRRWAIPSIRYDIYTYLDRRDSTVLYVQNGELITVRNPNPEHWIRFQFESRF